MVSRDIGEGAGEDQPLPHCMAEGAATSLVGGTKKPLPEIAQMEQLNFNWPMRLVEHRAFIRAVQHEYGNIDIVSVAIVRLDAVRPAHHAGWRG